MATKPTPVKCKWCQKTFQRPSQHQRHETQQLCLNKHKRTYCKICDVSYPDKPTYDRHLLTRQHMEKLLHVDNTSNPITTGHNTPTLADVRIVVHDPMYMADPLLTREEAEAISMGRDPTAKTMTIYTKDVPPRTTNLSNTANTIQPPDIAMGIRHMEKLTLEPGQTVAEKYAEIREAEKTPEQKEIERRRQQTTDYQKVLAAMHAPPAPTERQQRILQYLGRWQDQPTQTMLDKFKPILAALKLPDANYLRRHILEAPVTILTVAAKQVYVGYLDTFTEHIIQLSIEGTRTHLAPDVPFEQLVVNLNK